MQISNICYLVSLLGCVVGYAGEDNSNKVPQLRSSGYRTLGTDAGAEDTDECEDLNESSWIPTCWTFFKGGNGLGPKCFAVWTQEWIDEYGDLPYGLVQKITNERLLKHVRNKKCPFGIALPGQVTWPVPPADLKDVVTQPGVLKYLCVFWSYVPYLVAGRAILSFFWTLAFGNYDIWACQRRNARDSDMRSSFNLSGSVEHSMTASMTVDLPVITGSAAASLGSLNAEAAFETLSHLSKIRDEIHELEEKLAEARMEETNELTNLRQQYGIPKRAAEAAEPPLPPHPTVVVQVDDGPGLYSVIVGNACVSDSPDELFFDRAVYLNKDAIVTVVQVIKNHRGIRARIMEPIGWITLVNKRGQRLLAKKYVPDHYCTTRQLNCLFFLLFLMIIQEGILKKIIAEPRPGALLQLKSHWGFYAGSCITSCGMPSSHSALAVGWFTTIFLEARDNLILSTSPSTRLHFSLRRHVKWMLCEFAPFKPWTTSRGTLSRWAFTGYIFAWGMLMLPVPFARVVLYDHTTLQCFWGMISGFLIAIFWWMLLLGWLRTGLDRTDGWRLPSWIIREL